jgi:hypothetical protein
MFTGDVVLKCDNEKCGFFVGVKMQTPVAVRDILTRVCQMLGTRFYEQKDGTLLCGSCMANKDGG